MGIFLSHIRGVRDRARSLDYKREGFVKGSSIAFGFAIVVALCTACQGPAGPAGGAGGSGLYITDGSSRVYSGGSLNLGSLLNATISATPKALKLYNATGVALNVTKTNGMAVSPTSGYFIQDTSISHTWDANSPAGANGIQLGDIWVSTDMAATSIAPNASAPFSMIFDPKDGVYAVKGESHQDYDIALADSSGNPSNFVFEVYGVISC
jgi:hypothetical protein